MEDLEKFAAGVVEGTAPKFFKSGELCSGRDALCGAAERRLHARLGWCWRRTDPGVGWVHWGEAARAAGPVLAQSGASLTSPYLLLPAHAAPEPEEPTEGGVTVVVGNTVESIVLDPTKDVLLEVYAPWCGHCKVRGGGVSCRESVLPMLWLCNGAGRRCTPPGAATARCGAGRGRESKAAVECLFIVEVGFSGRGLAGSGPEAGLSGLQKRALPVSFLQPRTQTLFVAVLRLPCSNWRPPTRSWPSALPRWTLW